MAAARIYRPAPNAMQSGKGKSKQWVLVFEQSTPARDRSADGLHLERAIRARRSSWRSRRWRRPRPTRSAKASPIRCSRRTTGRRSARPIPTISGRTARRRGRTDAAPRARDACPSSSPRPSSPAACAAPALWRVSDSDSAIWLFGRSTSSMPRPTGGRRPSTRSWPTPTRSISSCCSTRRAWRHSGQLRDRARLPSAGRKAQRPAHRRREQAARHRRSRRSASPR